MKFIVAGLGNPGKKYDRTRHNAGFLAVDELGTRLGIALTQERHQSLVGRGRIEADEIVLAKPQTFMNLSGTAVSSLLRDGYLTPESLIVVHDELDLPVGTVRVKKGGGHGGHNGLRSLIEQLGTGDFSRVRIGIGRPEPGRDTADYVLAPFPAGERAVVAEAVQNAANAVLLIVSEGMTRAMNQFNQK
jgi:PTH1 family peptidyl-tRNA hydrolase